jgi:hypothetical protein
MRLIKIPKKSFRHFQQKMFIGLLLWCTISSVYAQEHIVTGIITDDTNMPIPGASIVVKGTTAGAISDIKGKFTLDLSGYDNPVIIISYIGYLTEEVDVGTQTELQVTLIPDLLSLDEVVVVGYGTQKKSDLTGAVASVSSEQLMKTPSSGAVQALQGKAAGVQVFNSSGMPGASITVRVRGINTITPRDEWTGVAGPIYRRDSGRY